jgi:long-chain fatty acid transport protein
MNVSIRGLAACSLACLATTALAQDGGIVIVDRGTNDSALAGAGAVARAGDASTAHWNAAGMTRVDKEQFVGGIAIAFGDVELDLSNKTQSDTQNGGGNAAMTTPVGGLYYMRPIDDRWAAGMSINGVYGGGVDYDEQWAGRSSVTKAEISVVNFEPSVAFEIDEEWSVGLGVRVVQGGFLTELRPAPSPTSPTAKVRKETDWDVGVSLSTMYQATEDLRLGARFTSETEFDFDGKVQAAGFGKAPFETGFTFPRSLSMGCAWELAEETTLLADVSWTDWSKFSDQPVRIGRQAGVTFDRDWRDTYRIGVGVEQGWGERVTLRTGVAYNSDPIRDSRRYPDIPTGESILIGAGMQYYVTRDVSVGVTYLLTILPSLDLDGVELEPARKVVLDGSYDDAKLHFWGVNVTVDF